METSRRDFWHMQIGVFAGVGISSVLDYFHGEARMGSLVMGTVFMLISFFMFLILSSDLPPDDKQRLKGP